VMLDKIADRGKAAGSCPLGFGREWCDRAAVISQGSGQGVEGEHPSEQAFAQNSLALHICADLIVLHICQPKRFALLLDVAATVTYFTSFKDKTRSGLIPKPLSR